MWIQVIFDLPVLTKKQRKKATKFRAELLKDGFIMMQFSVYIRPVPTRALREKHIRRVSKLVPEEGSVIILTFTDKQYGEAIQFYGSNTQELPTQPSLFDVF